MYHWECGPVSRASIKTSNIKSNYTKVNTVISIKNFPVLRLQAYATRPQCHLDSCKRFAAVNPISKTFNFAILWQENFASWLWVLVIFWKNYHTALWSQNSCKYKLIKWRHWNQKAKIQTTVIVIWAQHTGNRKMHHWNYAQYFRSEFNLSFHESIH